jgi:acetylornithine deacetylase/succinyl-diaminopimelate desuccinylase-like protein
VSTSLAGHVERTWDADVLPTLQEYITIPNVSAAFDADWKAHGHMDRAVDLVVAWCRARPIDGMTVEVHELPGRSPVVLVEVAARGGDDGYAVFAALTAIEAVQHSGLPHGRCIVLIEASEESGSVDLPAYLHTLADSIGTPELVVCLDSGCIDHDHLWVTTSLRGLVSGTLRVDVLEEGVHSGEAGGVVPSSFRILRMLLDRLEDPQTGRLLLPELHVEVPADRLAQLRATVAALADPVASHFPFVPGMRAAIDDPVEQMLAQTWRPSLSITGADGWPPTNRAGNVLRPFTALTLSLRLPPTCDHEVALAAVTRLLTDDPPYGARVSFEAGAAGPGWSAPSFAPWLDAALDEASTLAFGAPARVMGEGGSIPFMGMIGAHFPDAQIVVTGVLGPGSNAHGPNEFVHLPTAKNVTTAVASLLHAHATRPAACVG